MRKPAIGDAHTFPPLRKLWGGEGDVLRPQHGPLLPFHPLCVEFRRPHASPAPLLLTSTSRIRIIGYLEEEKDS